MPDRKLLREGAVQLGVHPKTVRLHSSRPLLTPLQVREGQTRDVGSLRMYQIGIDTQATKVADDR